MKKILIFLSLFSFLTFSRTESDDRLNKILDELIQVSEHNVEISKEEEVLLRDKIIEFAKNNLGRPYSWGSVGPNKFDCSGFVNYVFSKNTSIKLPRVSRDMATYAQKKKIDDLRIGDLLFFDTTNKNSTVNHVGIYIGNNEFIHASSAQKKVTISTIATGFYKKTFKWAISPF
ncbi:C40 family peptidase [Streptobacillus felis]|uniref:C40 family peptidase n=1 Tax=Streptobacillus felis TaxID=1384509 RepID=A0A7Z0PG43_9FUSO|nr:C40 family peptidase [Streptobacillus felis]NYV27445.1 C40 family peptidase [Streptobacillus felis]